MDKLLDGLVKRLKADAGANLRSVLLYGSAASGEFHAKHSDLNVLCLLYDVSPFQLGRLHKAAEWFVRKRHPLPLALSLEELCDAADIYAVELLEIKTHRRVLYGDDPFGSIEVPMRLHRAQVERELRHHLLGLRQGYIAGAGNRRAVLALMTRSAPRFALLCRHALIATGQSPSAAKREAVPQLASLLGFDALSFKVVFELRDGSRTAGELNYEQVFEKYLKSVTDAVSAVDRQFRELDR
jgi:hypothetical protein